VARDVERRADRADAPVHHVGGRHHVGAGLDVRHGGAREQFDLPVVAYNVSGEYSMVKAAAQNGWIDEQRIVLEILTGIKRAGADLIISYHARDVARWLG